MDGKRIETEDFDGKQNYRIVRIELLRPIMASLPPAHIGEAAWRILSMDIPIKLRVLKSVLEILNQENVDVVCLGELYSLSWLGHALRLLKGIPCVHYIHGEEITTNSASRFYGREQ